MYVSVYVYGLLPDNRIVYTLQQVISSDVNITVKMLIFLEHNLKNLNCKKSTSVLVVR